MSNSSTSAKQRPAKAKGKSAWSKGPPGPQTSVPSPHSQSPTPSASPSTQSQAHSRRPSALGRAVPIKDGVAVPRGNIGAAAAKQGSSITFGSLDDASSPIASSLAAPSVITPVNTVPDAPGIPASPPMGGLFGTSFTSKDVGSIASIPLPPPPSSTRRLSANSPTFVPRATPSHSTAWSSGPGSPSRGPGPSEEQRKKRRAEEAVKRVKKEEEHKKKEQEEAEQKRQAEEEEKAKERPANAEEERKRLEETERQKREAEVSFSTARYIENINAIKYPEGIQGPKSELNENATAGHIRYDRDFLLQFWSVCRAKPPNLARLDILGLDPNDPVVLERIRALPGRHRNSLPALLSRHSPVGPGLGGGSAFGIAALDTIDDIGNFGGVAILTSEERFAMASAGNPSVSGIPFVAGQTPTQETASQGGQVRKRTRTKRGDVQVKALLNQLTMENFDSISDQLIAWANKSQRESDGHSLIQVIRHLFGKAIDEPTQSEIYARLCSKMMKRISSKVQIDGIMNAHDRPVSGGQLFRKFLLDRCKGDFDRRWAGKETTADAAASRAAEDDAAKVADAGKDADTEEVALDPDEDPAAQRAKLQSVIKFMGELLKVQLLTQRIMHEYVKKFLGGDAENPEEENMESLCTLLTTVGAVLDTAKARADMNDYFSRVKEFAQSPNVNPRMQLMLQDLIELRENKWGQSNSGPSLGQKHPATSSRPLIN